MVEKSISTPLLDVPLPVGSRVVLYEDVSVERVNGEDVGATTGILFEGYVETHNPNTKLLEFLDSDVGKAKFLELFNKAEGIEVVY